MIISRTPFRISFFGGGTDYPEWYGEHGGAVLATTIDKYCYISVRELPPFFDHRFRVVYSIVENVKEIGEIQHPAVRGVLEWLKVGKGLEIHHDGDLPARSGLGSSSAFTVGLINAVHALDGRHIAKETLANEAIHVEQRVLRERVGLQDQVSAAFGGFNHITIAQNGTYSVAPIVLPPERLHALQSHLMLVFTGISRTANEVAETVVTNMKNKAADMRTMQQMVDQAIDIVSSATDGPRRVRPAPEAGVAAQALALGSRDERDGRSTARHRDAARARSAANCSAPAAAGSCCCSCGRTITTRFAPRSAISSPCPSSSRCPAAASCCINRTAYDDPLSLQGSRARRIRPHLALAFRRRSSSGGIARCCASAESRRRSSAAIIRIR